MSVVAIDRANIEPQLNGFFDGLDGTRLAQVGELTEQLRSNGNNAFNAELPYGSIRHTPVLLDDENLAGLFRETLRHCVDGGIRRPFIIAGNVSKACVDEERRAFNLGAIRRFGKVCAQLALPFSYYKTQYAAGTPISQIRADKHAAGLNYYRQQAKRHRKPPRDILLLSSDADLKYMDTEYTPEMEQQWKDSLAQAWIGGPVTTHDRLDGPFPRINKLLDWYDLGTEFFPSLFPTNYGVNAGAYAAIGGFGPTGALGELGEIIECSEAMFGDQDVDMSAVPNRVRNSCRQLVSKIVDGKPVAYSALHAPADKTPSYRRGPLPGADISVARFQMLLASGVLRLLTRAHVVLKEEVASNGRTGHKVSTPERTRKYIADTAALALQKAGDLDGTSEIVGKQIGKFYKDHGLVV